MDVMETTTTSNRYPGPCGRCGSKVPAGAGVYEQHNCWHASEEECNKSTKTWKRFDSNRKHRLSVRLINRLWDDADMRYQLLNATTSSPLSCLVHYRHQSFSWPVGAKEIADVPVNYPVELPHEMVGSWNEDGKRVYWTLLMMAKVQAEIEAIKEAAS